MAREVQVSGADAASADNGGSGFLYPEGEYIGQIIDIGPSKNLWKNGANAGKPLLDIKFKWTESGTGVGVGKKFVAFQIPDFPKFVGGSSAFLFYQFYKALGVEFPKDGEDGAVELPDFEDILGEEIGVRLSIELGDPKPDGSGNYPDRNRVAAFFPASKGVKESAAAATEVDDEFTL